MKKFAFFWGPTGEWGSISPIVALGLLAFVGFLALGIDLGQLYVVKNELQNVADSAALAGVNVLIQDQDGDGVAETHCNEAVAAAIAVAAKNNSLGAADPIKITPTDVIIGQWDEKTKSFVRTGPSANPMEANAVQVRVQRTGGDNPRVTTFFGGVLGTGSQQDSRAVAVAFKGNKGKGGSDIPLAVSKNYAGGQGPLSSNGFQRILEKFAPAPAYAAQDSQTYKWYDKGGSNLDVNRATMVVPEQAQLSLSWLQKYLKGEDLSGGKRFPQKKIGEKLYPISEYKWGSNIKNNFKILKQRWNARKDANGRWRVTVPVYSTDEVTACVPRNSWFKMASRLLPGVSQAHACAAYTVPEVQNQGFISLDITDVHVQNDCATSGDQVSNPDSCRNTCYLEIEVPLNQNTMSTDKGSSPVPYQKNYKDMNPAASEVGVFAATPVLVK